MPGALAPGIVAHGASRRVTRTATGYSRHRAFAIIAVTGGVMKAAALKGPRTMEIVELPDTTAGPGMVKLRVAYCGICGSDMH